MSEVKQKELQLLVLAVHQHGKNVSTYPRLGFDIAARRLLKRGYLSKVHGEEELYWPTAKGLHIVRISHSIMKDF